MKRGTADPGAEKPPHPVDSIKEFSPPFGDLQYMFLRRLESQTEQIGDVFTRAAEDPRYGTQFFSDC